MMPGSESGRPHGRGGTTDVTVGLALRGRPGPAGACIFLLFWGDDLILNLHFKALVFLDRISRVK